MSLGHASGQKVSQVVFTSRVRAKGAPQAAKNPPEFQLRSPNIAQKSRLNLFSRCANEPTCAPQSAAVESPLLSVAGGLVKKLERMVKGENEPTNELKGR